MVWPAFKLWFVQHTLTQPIQQADFLGLNKDERKARKNRHCILNGPTSTGGHKDADIALHYFLVLDLDKLTAAQMAEIKRNGFGGAAFFAHHTISSTKQAPKIHVFFPLESPCDGAAYNAAAIGAAERLEEVYGIETDQACFKPSQPMFAGNLCSDGELGEFWGGTHYVDVVALGARAAEIAAQAEAAEQAKRAKREAALQARPKNHRYVEGEEKNDIKARGKEIAEERFHLSFVRRGRDSWAPCPVHRGTGTTSFKWDDEREFFKCFSSKCSMTKGTDIFGLIAAVENRDNDEVVRDLCGAARGNTSRTRSSAPSGMRETPGDDEPWGEPEAIPPPLLPVPAFDPEALLPAVLRRWVMDEVNRMRCAPEFIAASVIAALGSVIGARCALKPKSRDDGWLVVPNVWGGLVGRPSTLKTPALSAALKPLGRLIANAQEAYREAMVGYDVKEVVFKAQEEAITKEIQIAAKDPKADTRQAETKLRLHREKGLEKPVLRRFKSNDATIEKLGEILRDNHNGLLVVRDELVGLLSRWDSKDGQEERTFFLEAWNGKESFDTDRIGRGHIFIPNLCLTVFGGIQPDKLLGHLRAQQGNNDGTFQRFGLLVYPDETSWDWSNDPADTQARDEAFKVFETLANFDPTKWGAIEAGGYAKFPTLTFAAGAQDLFVEWLTELRRERIPAEPDPLIQEHLGKYDGLFCQLAMIFHFVDCAANGYRGAVSEGSALLAAAWCEFLESHARRCYGLLHHDGFAGAYALSLKIADGTVEDGFTARDIRRNRWKHLTTAEDVEEAITKLIKREWLRPRAVGGTGQGSGRATTQYLINPDVRGARGAS